MPGTNQFLPFAVGAGANTLTPTAYAALASLLSNGFVSGVANSAQFNTALRQATTAAAGVAQFIANQGQNVNDDGSAANFAAAMSAAMASVASAALSFSSLVLSASGTSANVSISANELLLRGADGSPRLVSNVNLTLNTAGSGANGLDTGTLAASTWYSVWVINNSTTTAALLSLSATAPALPPGYTHKARVGRLRTDPSGNKFPLAFRQVGRVVEYMPESGTNVTSFPQAASSAATISVTSIALGSFVPDSAVRVAIRLQQDSVASVNNSISVQATATGQSVAEVIGVNSSRGVGTVWMTLRVAQTVYYSVQTSTGTGSVYVGGWEDNL